MKRILLSLCLLLVFASSHAQLVSTFAGTAGLSGVANGSGAAARFNNPHGMASDKAGNIYVTDRYNHLIRKITPAGVVSILAGTGTIGSTDGPGASATFNEPWGIACDTLGNIYVADTKNYKIRKIDASGIVSTIAGTGVFGTTNGTANVSSFGFPSGIATTRDGSIQYVTDYNTHVIRKITGGMVSNFAGTVYVAGTNDGPGITASFNHPYGIAIDNNGNLIVSDEWNNALRKITSIGIVSTYAGDGFAGGTDGPVSTCRFNYPWGIAVDSMNNIYVMDGYNFTVRKINTSSNSVATYAGAIQQSGSADGLGNVARFNNAAGITYNRADHSIYVADCNNHTIRKIVSKSTITLALSISGSTTVCANDSIRLNAVPANLSSYTFYNGATPVGNAVNGIITIAPLPSGTISLNCTALDSLGSVASSNTIAVTVLPAFVPTISGSSSFCNGDSIQLTAQSGTAYQWSSGLATQSVWVKAAGNFTVTVTNSNGCKGISAIHSVTSLARPGSTITSSATQICPNDSATLTAAAGSTYLWSNGAITQSISAHAGTFTVTVTAANGCTAKSSAVSISNFTVTPPSVSPTGTITIVQGDSVHLVATGGSSWTWSNTQTANSIYATTPGSYSVTASVGNGCMATSNTVQVIVISAASLMVATGPTSFCDGYNVVLQSLYPTGNQWYFNGSPIPGASAQQFTATDSGYYSVQVVINGNTIHSDSLLVSVKPSPQLVNVADTSICSGTSIHLSVKGRTGESYEWYDAPAAGSLLTNGTAYQTPALTSPSTYYIEVIGVNSCRSTARAALNVLMLPTPQAAFTTLSQAQSGQYIANFTNTSGNADSYLWIFGDTTISGNTSSDANPSHTYAVSGDYPVTLICTNSFGCSDTLSKTVRVSSNNELFIPTTFTPNGDGKNDLFRVRGDHFTVEEMTIYDQWGSVVYHADASSPTWDGRANGSVVENGTYVYKIRIVTDTQEAKNLTGPITVIK